MFPVSQDRRLASRWRRLGAVLIDIALTLIVMFAVSFALGMFFLLTGNEAAFRILAAPPRGGSGILAAIQILITYAALNGYLLLKRGQSIGKLALQIRIVNDVGGIPRLGQTLGRRFVLMLGLALIPGVGLLTLLDPFFIFRATRRCLHDDFAGTDVVEAW